MIITISTIRTIPEDIDPEEYFLECRTIDQKVVLFWGSVEYGSININSIRYQSLPVSIELLDQELCYLTEQDDENRRYWIDRQNADYSINELARIILLTEPD